MKIKAEAKKLMYDKNVHLCIAGGILFVLLANDEIVGAMDKLLNPILKPFDRALFNNNSASISRNLLIFVHGIIFVILLSVVNVILLGPLSKKLR
jgi:hypothetical protein